MDPNELVQIPRWAIEFVMDRGFFQDEGPAPEGWRSHDMQKAMEAIEAALSSTSPAQSKS